ncbi:MAG: LamG-like jellyroll fold domain-containing protein [Minisyncoccales bacterium]
MINRNKQKSFTLIELLVVIVIIGILAGVIMISTSSSIDKANFAKAKAFSSTVQNELLSNLVSEWTFDEPEEGGKTKDTWGNNHGTVVGATQVDDCVFGKCYSFNGTSDYINIGGDSSLKLENSGTIIAWIYPTSLTGFRVFYGSSGGADVDKTPYFMLNGGQLRAYLGNGTNLNYVNSGYYPKLNAWSFVGLSWDGTNINSFYNTNIKSLDQTYPVKFTASTYFIGKPGQVDRNFAGLIDNVRIYNSALSLAQVKKEYIAGLESLYLKGIISKDEFEKRLEGIVLTKLPSRSIFQLYDK